MARVGAWLHVRLPGEVLYERMIIVIRSHDNDLVANVIKDKWLRILG